MQRVRARRIFNSSAEHLSIATHSANFFFRVTIEFNYTEALIVGIARWSVPRIGQGHLEVKW